MHADSKPSIDEVGKEKPRLGPSRYAKPTEARSEDFIYLP